MSEPVQNCSADIVERMRNHVDNRGGASLQNGAWQMMLDAASEIENLRAERHELTMFSLETAQYKAFLTALDEPVQPNARLKQLLARAPAATVETEEMVPKRLLDERDDFIVARGLWSEFLYTLPLGTPPADSQLYYKSFFANLTPEQQKAALEYTGPENHGNPDNLPSPQETTSE